MVDPVLEGIVNGGGTLAWRARILGVLLGITLLAAAGGGYALLREDAASSGSQYATEPVTRGPLTVTVSATGTLQPTNQVDVGSELSGIVAEVLVSDNDRIKRGQMLARLDTAKLALQVSKARATLASSEAKVNQYQATLAESRATLERLRQVAELSGGKVPSKAELATGEAAVERATADLQSARASVREASASLQTAQADLSKASIRSPIDGVVLARKVEPGQTVAASLQAPVLFTLAENLAQMELVVNVDEADVGQVKEGQEAVFTVDAYANRRFPARVTKVRYGSATVDGVVSYKTSLQVDNADLSLRPGMTAAAQITVVQREDALLVPNAALRFSPPAARSGKPSRSLLSALLPRPPAEPARKPAVTSAAGSLWVLRDGRPLEIQVSTGASDRRHTEISSPQLEPGTAVITDMRMAAG